MEFEAMDEPSSNDVIQHEDCKDRIFSVTSDEHRGHPDVWTGAEPFVDSGAYLQEEERESELAGGGILGVVTAESCSPPKDISTISCDPWDQECEEEEEAFLAAMHEYENSDPTGAREDTDSSKEEASVGSFERVRTLQNMADDQGKDVLDPAITGEGIVHNVMILWMTWIECSCDSKRVHGCSHLLGVRFLGTSLECALQQPQVFAVGFFF